MNDHDNNHDDLDQLREEGRRLASQRDDLIAAGVDPAEVLIPIAPMEPAHRTEPAHDTPSTHAPGTAATSDARKRHAEQLAACPTCSGPSRETVGMDVDAVCAWSDFRKDYGVSSDETVRRAEHRAFLAGFDAGRNGDQSSVMR